jgi:hypothetical protein
MNTNDLKNLTPEEIFAELGKIGTASFKEAIKKAAKEFEIEQLTKKDNN